MNYEFNLNEWLPRFPLRERHGHYSGEDVTSPYDICNNEWLRRGMVKEYDWGEPVPVDIFIMSKGEPENRFATKIGGLPYRSRNLPWPCTQSGRPLALLAQFNFTNSVDIFPGLPGDLLLVFGDDSDEFVRPKHVEWQRLGIQDLVTPTDLPSECMEIAPCFGNRCRMLSYPSATRTTDTRYPKCHGKDVWSDYWIPTIQATQIGRAPFFIQPDDETLPGQPLCTIASVQPERRYPHPWVNVPEPLCPEGSIYWGGTDLMIGDLGCIYIFMEDDGTLHFQESCY